MITPEDIDTDYTPPNGWQERYFQNAHGYRLRSCHVMPDEPDGIVAILPGLNEFGELYAETARDLLARNMGVFIIDWLCQGGSDRLLDNRHKRHTISFEAERQDLDTWLHSQVLPARTSTTGRQRPLIMLAHSMGGNHGMHQLYKYPGLFDAAGFSAPMFGIHLSKYCPGWLRAKLNTAAGSDKQTATRSLGVAEWSPKMRRLLLRHVFTRNAERGLLHNKWLRDNRELRIGSPTLRWALEAEKACRSLDAPDLLSKISTPCLIAKAGRDKLVNNDAIERIATQLANAELLELHEACHELLMERDSSRLPFKAAFFSFLEKNAYPYNGKRNIAKPRSHKARFTI